MALTPHQQALLDFAKTALPRYFFEGTIDTPAAFAVILDRAREQVDEYVINSYIVDAVGIWLDAHALDRGTSRQGSEDDLTLSARLRNFEDIVTRPALLRIAQALCEAAGIVMPPGYPAMVELRRERAFFQTATGDGFKVAYMSRGYRMTNGLASFIIILPYGTSQALANGVAEAVRKKKAAGTLGFVERRIDP